MKAACYLVGAYPDLAVSDYAAFCAEWDGAGEYDDRQLAREFAKAKLNPANVSRSSDGAAFGAVVDEDEESQNEDSEADQSIKQRQSAAALLLYRGHSQR
jgi:hypothetical protein